MRRERNRTEILRRTRIRAAVRGRGFRCKEGDAADFPRLPLPSPTGHQRCVKNGTCTCDKGYTGELCNTGGKAS